jgi:hypothetical protein
MISRAMRKADIGTIAHSKGSLRDKLVRLKDKLPHTSKSGVIYHAPCAGKTNEPCTACYIGETERSMDIRFKEQYNKAKLPNTDTYASAIGKHARETHHHFRPEDITYLDKETNKLVRGMKEAIFTRALDHPLNRGGSLRHDLPHHVWLTQD